MPDEQTTARAKDDGFSPVGAIQEFIRSRGFTEAEVAEIADAAGIKPSEALSDPAMLAALAWADDHGHVPTAKEAAGPEYRAPRPG